MKQKGFKFLAITLCIASGVPGIISNYVVDNKISTTTSAYAKKALPAGWVFETCTTPGGGSGGKCVTTEGSCGASTACD